ncbi:MAG: hypothetical protein IJU84_09330, partial [Clostridia bacterium]|nr:hypothetical protein [Clostridia bacterium]
ADFFHFSGCKGVVHIENCKAAGAHDDFVNVHGTHLRIVETNEDEKSLRVRFENPNTWGLRAFYEKDDIEFIKKDTLLPYAKRKIKKVERISDKEYKLFLYKTPPQADIGKDVIENATLTPELIVEGNSFGPSMGRGILCTTRKKTEIKNNIFYKNGGSVLHVSGDCNYWMESGYTKNICFKNNTVIDCGYGPGGVFQPLICVAPEVMKEGPVHGTIRIEGNKFITDPDTTADNYFHCLKKVIVKNNIFEKIEDYYEKR